MSRLCDSLSPLVVSEWCEAQFTQNDPLLTSSTSSLVLSVVLSLLCSLCVVHVLEVSVLQTLEWKLSQNLLLDLCFHKSKSDKLLLIQSDSALQEPEDHHSPHQVLDCRRPVQLCSLVSNGPSLKQ